MFDVGFSELVLIALLALIVLGPKRLPEVARTAGRWLGRLRRFMNDVKQDLDKELHSAELTELRKLKQELDDTRRVIEESSGQLYRDISDPSPPSTPTIAPPPDTPAIETPTKPARPKTARTKRAKRAVKTDGKPKS
ncbi:MAG: Sec-independent protein translocase protein TatB [Gammaproteobacteria bacterium]